MHYDAGPQKWKCICIHLQCGGPALRCIYLSPKIPADDQTDRNKITKGPRTTGRSDGHTDEQTDGRTDILYCHSGYLSLWPAAACVARNYGMHE